MSATKKNRCNFIPMQDEVAAVLYFLSKGVKLHFYSLGTIFEENMRVPRGAQLLWLWVSNRGESIPVVLHALLFFHCLSLIIVTPTILRLKKFK